MDSKFITHVSVRGFLSCFKILIFMNSRSHCHNDIMSHWPKTEDNFITLHTLSILSPEEWLILLFCSESMVRSQSWNTHDCPRPTAVFSVSALRFVHLVTVLTVYLFDWWLAFCVLGMCLGLFFSAEEHASYLQFGVIVGKVTAHTSEEVLCEHTP